MTLTTPGGSVLPDPHRSPLTWHAVALQFTVHDGDTLTDCLLDTGWRQAKLDESVRLTSSMGPINAPEVTGHERPAGLLVRDAVRAWLHGAERVWLRSRRIEDKAHPKDSRGRTVAEVWVSEAGQDRELGSWMLERGLAKFCKPDGSRIPFTDEELADIVARLQEPARGSTW